LSVRKRIRNWVAVAAHFRGSAGAMKDRRAPRKGTCNESRDLIHQGMEEFQDEEEDQQPTVSGVEAEEEA
jgi:hypothetical protein